MKNKLFLVAFILLYSLITFAQKDQPGRKKDSLIFIGEVQWEIEKLNNGVLGKRVPYYIYKDIEQYKIHEIFLVNWNNKIKLGVQEYKKEGFYSSPELPGVEVRLSVPDSVFKDGLRSVSAKGCFDHHGIIRNKGIPQFNIIKPKRGTDNYIDSNTFKLSEPIVITFPADMSVNIITAFIDDKLEISDSADGYRNTIQLLDTLVKTPKPEINRRISTQLYRLLHFISPFLSERSFLRFEAEELYGEINDLEKEMLKQQDNKNSDSLRTEHAELTKIYEHYRFSFQRYFNYYNRINDILFSQYERIGARVLKPSYTIQLGVGMSALYDLTQVYDVSTSPVDTTVQFQKIPRLQPAISVGMLFNLTNAFRDTINHNGMADSIYQPRLNHYLAFQVSYFFGQSFRQSRMSFPVSLGLGYGISKGRFLYLLSIGVRRSAVPRTFFKDEFLGKNQKLLTNGPNSMAATTIDPGDDKLFIEKYNLNAGLTLHYLIGK